MKTTTILSIETSCDETAVALLRCKGGIDAPTYDVIGKALYSQADKHAEYGGVYPNLAKREHAQNLVPLFKKALKEAGLENPSNESIDIDEQELQAILEREAALSEALLPYLSSIAKPDIDAIAVTRGPGLEPALWVGINFAKALSTVWDIPLVPVNHLEGHIISVLASDDAEISFPALGYIVSGGHTELVLINNWFEYKTIGRTRDDAVGEAFDKVARMLDLPYPGGPHISKQAEQARKQDIKSPIDLPRPMMTKENLDFSFSGLKTAVLYALRENKYTQEEKMGIAREFEDAITDVLSFKLAHALKQHQAKSVIAAGGVMANTHIRENLKQITDTHSLPFLLPPTELATDNAVMIGMAGYLRLCNGETAQARDIDARGRWSL